MGHRDGAVGDVSPTDLGRLAVRGGAVIFAATAAQNVGAFAVMAVLARLLTPEDYGLMAMVFAISGFGQVFSDMGLTMASVQKKGLTNAQLSTLFWVNLSFSVALSVAAAALAPAIGWFYADARVVPLALLGSTSFALSGLGMQHAALMLRRMQFGRLAVCDLAAVIAGGAVGIGMAFRGWGPYALVGQALAQVSAKSIAAWALADWRPGFPHRGSGVRGMLKFGGYLTAFNGVNYFARNADKVLLGRFWGPATVGVYSRGYALMMWPIGMISGPMMKVMMPALSRLQDDRTRFIRVNVRVMTAIAFVTFPVGGGLAVIGEDVVLAVYGETWRAAVGVFRILCLSAILQPWMSSLGGLYMSAGRTRDMWLWGCISSAVIVTAIAATAWIGALAVAAGFSVAILLLIPFAFRFATSRLGIPLSPILRAGVGPLAATAAMMAAVMLYRVSGVAASTLPVRLLAEVSLGVSVYLLASLVFAKGALREAYGTLGRFTAEASMR